MSSPVNDLHYFYRLNNGIEPYLTVSTTKTSGVPFYIIDDSTERHGITNTLSSFKIRNYSFCWYYIGDAVVNNATRKLYNVALELTISDFSWKSGATTYNTNLAINTDMVGTFPPPIYDVWDINDTNTVRLGVYVDPIIQIRSTSSTIATSLWVQWIGLIPSPGTL